MAADLVRAFRLHFLFTRLILSIASTQPDDSQQLIRLLSEERLGPFLTLAGTYPAAIDLHLDTLRLGGTLMTVTGMIEIALRNSICELMEQHFGRADWLTAPPTTFHWLPVEREKIRLAEANARKAKYAKLSPAARHLMMSRATGAGESAHVRQMSARTQLEVSRGEVIAQLTLFFWKRLYAQDYEARLWRRLLKSTFPNKALSRADVAVRLEILYQNRNRVAHHEPVHGHRLHEALQAIDFLVNEFGESNDAGKRYLACLVDRDVRRLRDDARILQATIAGFKK